MAFELVKSPPRSMVAVFWLYLVVLLLGVRQLLVILRERRVLVSHFRDIFQVLTRLRVWTMKNRRTYTGLVAASIVSTSLVMVYYAEQAHYTFFDSEPLFTSGVEFFYWIFALIVSGGEQGRFPHSVLGIFVIGVLPVFLFGSILAIVRVTSEQAHESLARQLARGEFSSRRIVLFNYQGEFEEVARTVLEQTDAFLVLLAAGEHLQDARGLRDSFEETDSERFRIHTEELTYSADLLVEDYSLLEASEVYMLSDMREDTDYKTLQLLTELDEIVEERDSERRLGAGPQIFWEVRNPRFERLTDQLDSELMRQNVHPLGFYDDCARLVLSNLTGTTTELNRYYRLTDGETPDWVSGTPLSDYRFRTTPLTEPETELVDQIARKQATEPASPDVAETKRELLDRVNERVAADRGPDGVETFYGLVTDIAGLKLRMSPSMAYLSQQVETADGAVTVTHAEQTQETRAATTPGSVYVINLNSNSRQVLRRIESADGPVADEITVLHRQTQRLPEFDSSATFESFESVNEVVTHLFGDETTAARLDSGDALVLFLDRTNDDPHVDSMRIIDALDGKLNADRTTHLDHNEVFLSVESHADRRHKVYEYLSVDKTINSLQPRKSFLRNLIQFRHDGVVRRLVREEDLGIDEAFEWAVECASYLRAYDVRRPADVDLSDEPLQSVAGQQHSTLVSGLREYDDPSGQLFTGLRVKRREPAATPCLELRPFTPDRSVEDDEYLLFFPQI